MGLIPSLPFLPDSMWIFFIALFVQTLSASLQFVFNETYCICRCIFDEIMGVK